MDIESGIPMPMTAAERIEKLEQMRPGDSFPVEKSAIVKWRYPLIKAQRRGDCHYFARLHGDGYRIWRHS